MSEWTDQIRTNQAAIQQIIDDALKISELPALTGSLALGDMTAFEKTTGEVVFVTLEQLIDEIITATVSLEDLTDVAITGAVKGDLLVRGSTNWNDLTVGTNGYILSSDSSELTGLKWIASSAGVTELSNLTDVTSATQTSGFVLASSGGDYIGRLLLMSDLPALARISGSTYSTIQHLQDVFHSSGWVSGGGITDDADGTITVALGTGLIRGTDSSTAEILFFDWADESGANVDLIDNDINYIYVEYNAGSPQVVARTVISTDFNRDVLLAVISREGTELHINETDRHEVGDHANNMIRRLKETMPYGHVSGAIISEVGVRNIAITSGIFWRGLTRFNTSAIDTSSSSTFSYYYNDGSWQKVTSQTQIDNTQYNDFGVGIETLSNNRYGVHWIYKEADDADVAVLYGIGDYTLSEAEDAQAPASVPQHLIVEGILVGKIIIKKSNSVFTQIESAFQTTFSGSLAQDHSNLSGLGSDDHTHYLLIDGARAMTGDLDLDIYNLKANIVNLGGTNPGLIIGDGMGYSAELSSTSIFGGTDIMSIVKTDGAGDFKRVNFDFSLLSGSDISALKIPSANGTIMLVEGLTDSIGMDEEKDELKARVDIGSGTSIDWELGISYIHDILTQNETFTDSNLPSGTDSKTITLDIDLDTYSITFPAYYIFKGGDVSSSGKTRIVIDSVNGTGSSEEVYYTLIPND